ncbi:MAG: MaoC family dehydratase [Candidatus Eremiobacteraeota bacterium]|nr:MaoC family dehydratase [Candidatus Eremiobacteraeota bacterium]
MVYLDDFKMGDSFETRPYAVELEESLAFARTYDPQSFHLDSDAATRSIFGELTSSGWYTAAVTMRLVADSNVMQGTGVLGRGIDELRWLAPVKPGDTLRVRGEVVEQVVSTRRPDRGTLRVRLLTLNQHGITVMSQIANLIVPVR